jgi:hypothetical protein
LTYEKPQRFKKKRADNWQLKLLMLISNHRSLGGRLV